MLRTEGILQTQPEFVSEQAHLSLKRDYEQLIQINAEQQQKIAFLEQELAQLKRMIFGAKSERFVLADSTQMSLELEGVKSPEEQAETQQICYTREKPKKKGKAVRLELPAHLPRQTQTIEPENLAEGAKKIGEVITEILEYNPGRLYVKRYVRPLRRSDQIRSAGANRDCSTADPTDSTRERGAGIAGSPIDQ